MDKMEMEDKLKKLLGNASSNVQKEKFDVTDRLNKMLGNKPKQEVMAE